MEEIQKSLNNTNTKEKKSNVGLFGTIGLGTCALVISAATLPFVLPAFRKHTLPYVPATTNQIENVFKAIKTTVNKAGDKKTILSLIDLGSGDGRIVFEASKRGFRATGVELNTVLYLYSIFHKLKFKSLNRDLKPHFIRGNLWSINLTNYDLIVVFGVQEMMKDLASKLKKELKEDSKIISCRFPIDSYKAIYELEDGVDSVWVYDKTSLN